MRRNVVYGYLDESPALSDEVLFFCADIISTSDKISKRLRNIIKRARKSYFARSKTVLRLSRVFHDLLDYYYNNIYDAIKRSWKDQYLSDMKMERLVNTKS